MGDGPVKRRVPLRARAVWAGLALAVVAVVAGISVELGIGWGLVVAGLVAGCLLLFVDVDGRAGGG